MRGIIIAAEADRRGYSISIDGKNVETFYDSEVMAVGMQDLFAYILHGKETSVAKLESSVTDDHEFIDFTSEYKNYVTRGGSGTVYSLNLYRGIRFATGLSFYTLLQYRLEQKLIKRIISAPSAPAMLL